MILRRFARAAGVVALWLLGAGLQADATEHRLSPDQTVVGSIYTIEARYEDTFADLGEAYGFGQHELIAANPGIDPWLPGEGAELVMPGKHVLPDAPRTGIVINLP